MQQTCPQCSAQFEITDKDLDRGIEICNTNRRLLKELYEFRKKDDPSITGLESLEVALASQLIDKNEHNQALEALIKELPQRKLDRDPGTRLMIVGSEDDDRKVRSHRVAPHLADEIVTAHLGHHHIAND